MTRHITDLQRVVGLLAALAACLLLPAGCQVAGGGGGDEDEPECADAGEACDGTPCCTGLECVEGFCETPGGEGEGEDESGTLSGTITNSLTGAPLAGVAVGLDPAVEEVSIVAGDDGAYTAEVPGGVYTLTFEVENYASQSRTVSVEAGATTTVDAALVPAQAVAVGAVVEGDAAPGATLTVTADVEILDGSTTVAGYEWSQSNSVAVTIEGADTETATIVLPEADAFKEELLLVLSEPPITAEQLPPNVPLPEGEFPAALQDRFEIVGMTPFDLEEAALITLEVAAITSTGTFTSEVEIHAALPWKPSAGIRNVPVGLAVLLNGKTQDDYDWALAGPAGSEATLTDAETKNPYFVPDVSGLYTVTVTDLAADPVAEVTLEIYAGTWEGSISGQDADGRPVSAACTACHNGTVAGDQFTPWAQTGHAEIFTDSLNTSDHYAEHCFACHTVGFDLEVDNGGMDDAEGYADFLEAGLINHPGDNWTTVLADYPEMAQLANVQCENCHGPHNGGAHTTADPRYSISSTVCGVCHGEPLRHGRYQQWQLSGHANYELAIEESSRGSCARCHTGNGFLAWLPILLDDDPATDPLADVEVTWTADQTHPMTCTVCHDPHSIGTVSGSEGDATVRISGNTPLLIAGYTVYGAGGGAICMTCHNSRRGLRNEATFAATTAQGDAARAPHGSAQTDVLMGENAYLVEVGVRGSHSLVTDSCVNCHMRQTPPPELLSYQSGGTNHTFFAGDDICVTCHDEIEAESIKIAYEATSERLLGLVEDALLTLLEELLADGNTIDLDGQRTIASAEEIAGLEFGEFHGRQAIAVTFTDGVSVELVAVDSILVLDGDGAEIGHLYDLADARLVKAGWNWALAYNDGSSAIHNPPFVFGLLDAAIDALAELAAE